MTQYIEKSALVAEIKKRKNLCEKIALDLRNQENKDYYQGKAEAYKETIDLLDTLEVKEVNNVWHEVDNINLPQPDKNKIYCVLSKNKYLLARVREHPHDELLQWKCTEFPYHCYDMCEGDKYMQIS